MKLQKYYPNTNLFLSYWLLENHSRILQILKRPKIESNIYVDNMFSKANEIWLPKLWNNATFYTQYNLIFHKVGAILQIVMFTWNSLKKLSPKSYGSSLKEKEYVYKTTSSNRINVIVTMMFMSHIPMHIEKTWFFVACTIFFVEKISSIGIKIKVARGNIQKLLQLFAKIHTSHTYKSTCFLLKSHLLAFSSQFQHKCTDPQLVCLS